LAMPEVKSSMEWKQLLASITGSVDEELRLRNAYLVAENRILRNQITGRVQLTDAERKTLAEIGQKLGRQALEEVATIAQPDTILAWHRKFAPHPSDSCQPHQSVGRPRLAKELEDLVVRMARENRSWGYDRMVGALTNLGYRLSDQTVGNILKRHGVPPAPSARPPQLGGSLPVSTWTCSWPRISSTMRCGVGVGWCSVPCAVSSMAVVAKRKP